MIKKSFILFRMEGNPKTTHKG